MKHPMDEERTHIAIIDEDPEVRELYGLEFTEAGYEVVGMSDVASAQELIARCEPDVVLLDPYDGRRYRWDVLAEIRDRNVQLPILICLPFEMRPDDPHCGPVDSCVIKSSDVSGLVSKVQSLLATKAANINTLPRQMPGPPGTR
jgi:DNA-binding NtrC family response regulator